MYGIGTVSVKMFFSCGGSQSGVLYSVLYVPDLSTNLFSV